VECKRCGEPAAPDPEVLVPTIELTTPETDEPVIPRQRTSDDPATRSERHTARAGHPTREPSAARALRGAALLLVLGHQLLPYDTAAAAGPAAFAVALACLRTGARRTERPRHSARPQTGWQTNSTGATLIMWLGVLTVLAAGLAPLSSLAGGPMAGLGAVAMLLAARRACVASLDGPLASRPAQYAGRLAFPAFGWMAAFVVLPALVDRGLPFGVRAGLALAGLLPAVLTLRQFDVWNRNRSPIRPGGSYVIAAGAALSLGGLVLAPAGAPRPLDPAAELVATVSSAPPAPTAPATADLPGGAGCWSVAPNWAPASCSFGDKAAAVSVALAGGTRAGAWLTALELLAAGRHWHITSFLAQDCALTATARAGACANWVHHTQSAIGSGNYELVLLDDSSPTGDHSVVDALRKSGKKVVTVPDTGSLADLH
jgi:hypothetical protein